MLPARLLRATLWAGEESEEGEEGEESAEGPRRMEAAERLRWRSGAPPKARRLLHRL